MRDAVPVRRLPRPLFRAAGWLVLAGTAMGGVIAVDGVCPNLAARLADPLYAASLAAAGATGALAAMGAFLVSLPDRSRLWTLLPVPAGLTWMGLLAAECLTRPAAPPDGPVPLGNTLHCATVFLSVSALLTVSLFYMLRPGPLAHGRETGWLAGIAAGGLATVGFALTRTFEAPFLLLTWNLGAGALTMLAVTAFWRRAARGDSAPPGHRLLLPTRS